MSSPYVLRLRVSADGQFAVTLDDDGEWASARIAAHGDYKKNAYWAVLSWPMSKDEMKAAADAFRYAVCCLDESTGDEDES